MGVHAGEENRHLRKTIFRRLLENIFNNFPGKNSEKIRIYGERVIFLLTFLERNFRVCANEANVLIMGK